MRIAFWGSSLVSAYWNGAATYYRGILRALAERGHTITFYEPDAYSRQQHRDIPDPKWARIVVYDPNDLEQVSAYLNTPADVLVKASGVGVLDEWLEARVSAIGRRSQLPLTVFWDVDAPATLDRLANHPEDPFHQALPGFQLVLTYGGGNRVVSEYRSQGARECVVIYNAFDPDVHYPVSPDDRFRCDLSFLGNRLPDREVRVENYFLRAAELASDKQFLLGGSGWHDKAIPANVRYVGHVYTRDHNTFNCSAGMVLNISRDSMAEYGFSPATRVFEAAGAAACLITDNWLGLDSFLEPEREVLVASDAFEVARLLRDVTPERAKAIGEAARQRVLAEHTYKHRGALVESTLLDALQSFGLSETSEVALEMQA